MTLLPPVFVVQAITAHVGPVPSTRGPFVIFTACAFGARLGLDVAEPAKAAVKAMITSNFINLIPPCQNGSKILSGSMQSGGFRFSRLWPLKKLFACNFLAACVTHRSMRNWMRERMKRRKKKPENETEATGRVGQQKPLVDE